MPGGNGKGGEIRTREWSRNLRDRRGSRCAGNSCNSKRRTRSWPLVPELPSSLSLSLSSMSATRSSPALSLAGSLFATKCAVTPREEQRAEENATTSRVADAKRIAGLGRLLRITSCAYVQRIPSFHFSLTRLFPSFHPRHCDCASILTTTTTTTMTIPRENCRETAPVER